MDPDQPRADRAAPSRRGFLGGGLVITTGVALGTGGCALNNPLDTTPTPAVDAVRDLAPDVAVAVEAVTAIRGAARLVDAIAARHPALTASTTPLVAMHRAHLGALVDAVPERVDTSSTDAPARVPVRRPLAERQLTAGERTLHGQLTALALRAESGPFARLLGSMAASISQHLAAGLR